MNRIFGLTFILFASISNLQAATTYNINSNTTWSASFSSYCGDCTINIASGVTLNLNNSGMCDNCTITGGTIKITGGFSFQSTSISNTNINATSSFSLDNTNSFNNVTAVFSGNSAFASNGALTLTNSTFTFQNNSSFTSNSKLDLDNSRIYLNDNSYLVSNSSTVNLKNGSTIVAGDGSVGSKAYMIFYGRLNIVDNDSHIFISNKNNYYLSWNTYTGGGTTYSTTNNNKNCGNPGQNACAQEKYYGGASFSSTGPLPITVLATTIGDFRIVKSNSYAVALSWKLTDVSGSGNLQVERSNDGQHFNSLATIPAGLSDAGYSYTDGNPSAGENDYRIKLTGADGKISYSKIISVKLTEAGQTNVFPNPCIGGNFQIRVPSEQSAVIRVFSLDGKLLYTNPVSGQLQYSVNIPGAGNNRILVVQVATNEKTSTFNLLNIH